MDAIDDLIDSYDPAGGPKHRQAILRKAVAIGGEAERHSIEEALAEIDDEYADERDSFACPECGYEMRNCLCIKFADPGGNSALRAASESNPRNLPCPNCHEPNRLTPADVAQNYVCDRCADATERGWP